MAKNDNLKDYLTDLYEGIKSKNPNASRNPQDFRQEIESIESGATIKKLEQWQGTIVNETTENIYFNTNLSAEEVNKIIQNASLTYNDMDMYGIYYNDNTGEMIALINIVGQFAIFDQDFNCLFNGDKTDESFGFYGWNPEISTPLPITIDALNMFGLENDKLTALVSSTPFVLTQEEIELNGEYNETELTINKSGFTNIENLIFNEKKVPLNINVVDLYSKEQFIENKAYLFDGEVEYDGMVGKYAFAGCVYMTSVKKSESGSIGKYAFAGCGSLTSARFEDAFQINEKAFCDCEVLTDIYTGSNEVVQLDKTNAFDGCPMGLKIHVRSEYADQYATATNWSSLIESGQIVIVGDYSE